jgi:hypothetical protein
LLRFAEPVRGRGSPAEALERLVARGELVLGDGADITEDDSDDAEAEDNQPEGELEPELPPQDLSAFENFGDTPDFEPTPGLDSPPGFEPTPELSSLPEFEPREFESEEEA